MRERIVSKVGVFKIHADVADYRLSIFKFSTFLFLFFYSVCNIYKIRYSISIVDFPYFEKCVHLKFRKLCLRNDIV